MEIQETMTKKHFDPYKIDIRELSIYVCDYCNKSCRHCYIKQSNNAVKPEWIEWVVNNFKINQAILVGGEPIISPVLPKILEILKNADVKITLSTNCKWIEWGAKKKKKTLPLGPRDMKYMDVIDLLKGKVSTIQISIEGNKKTTDDIRGKGSYNNSMEAVDLLKKHGFDVFFRATYSKKNYDDIPHMLELATEKNVHLMLFPYKGRDSVPLDEEQQEQLYNTLMDYTTDDGERMATCHIPQYYTYIGQHGYCPAGRNLINIMPDGLITPCEMSVPPDYFPLGKFDENNGININSLRRRIKIFLETSKNIAVECMTCKHHQICRSGCHETREYMNCPMKYNINYGSFSDVFETNRMQTKAKLKSIKNVMNRRKGC